MKFATIHLPFSTIFFQLLWIDKVRAKTRPIYECRCNWGQKLKLRIYTPRNNKSHGLLLWINEAKANIKPIYEQLDISFFGGGLLIRLIFLFLVGVSSSVLPDPFKTNIPKRLDCHRSLRQCAANLESSVEISLIFVFKYRSACSFLHCRKHQSKWR